MRKWAAACLMTAIATPAVGAGEKNWPTSPEFTPGTVLPNQRLGATWHGWTDQGGGLVADAERDEDELWQLVFVKAGAATIVIVTPESRSADGSIVSWRVQTTLLMDRETAVPLAQEACMLVSGDLWPVLARWSPGRTPSNVWTFDPVAGRFEALAAADVLCEAFE